MLSGRDMVLSKEPLLPTQLPDMMAIVTCYNLEIMYMYDKHIQQHNQCNSYWDEYCAQLYTTIST